MKNRSEAHRVGGCPLGGGFTSCKPKKVSEKALEVATERFENGQVEQGVRRHSKWEILGTA